MSFGPTDQNTPSMDSEIISAPQNTVEQLNAKIAQLQTDIDDKRKTVEELRANLAEERKALPIKKRHHNLPDLEDDLKSYRAATPADQDYFRRYYKISVQQADKLVKLKNEKGEAWDGYENAIGVLSLGTSLYHQGYGAPPGDLDYAYQAVVRIIKEILEDEAFSEQGAWSEMDYDGDIFRELEENCGEFWHAWNV